MSRVSTFGLPWTQSGCSAAPGCRIVPGAGGQLHHAGHDVVCNSSGGQARAAIVEQADDVAIGDAAARGIGGVETDGFAAGDFLGLAVGAEIELAVQPGRRLVGDQRQRVARIRRLGRGQPGRVGRAIVVTEACDGFRMDLDLAAWRRQLVVERDRCGRRAGSRRHRGLTAARVRRAARTLRSQAHPSRHRQARAASARKDAPAIAGCCVLP